MKPSERVAGSYSGDAVMNTVTYSCTASITANGDNQCNVSFVVQGTTYTVNGVNLTYNEGTQTTSFSYTNSTTTTNEATSLSGQLSGNNLTLSAVVVVSFSVTKTIAITATKQ